MLCRHHLGSRYKDSAHEARDFALDKFLHAASAASGDHILRGKNLDLCGPER